MEKPPEQPVVLKTSYYQMVSVVIWIMLLLYCLPVYAIIYCAFVNPWFSDPHVILSLFSALVKMSDDSYSIFHRVLIPLMSGFSVIAFRDRTTSRNTLFLIIVILFSIVGAIGMNVYFSIEKVSGSLENLSLGWDMNLAKTFLNRIQEVLGTFLMMLLGLKMSENVMLKKEGDV